MTMMMMPKLLQYTVVSVFFFFLHVIWSIDSRAFEADAAWLAFLFITNTTRQPYHISLIKLINHIVVCASGATIYEHWTLRIYFYTHFLFTSIYLHWSQRYVLQFFSSSYSSFLVLLCAMHATDCCGCSDLPIIAIDLFMQTKFQCLVKAAKLPK